MARRSGSSWLGVRAVALTVAYALVLQLLLASVFAARATADSLGSQGSFLCMSGPSAAPSDKGGEGHPVAHCPLCILRVDLALPPGMVAESVARHPATGINWRVTTSCRRHVSPFRDAHHPRGPPPVLSLV